MAKRIPVAEAATQLGVRAQLLYDLIRKNKLEATKPAGSRSKCVDPDLAKQVIEAEKNRPKNQGGRHLNWAALTSLLEKSKAKEVHLEVSKMRVLVEAPKAKLEMLHYWDPYRALSHQGPGLKAIRAAGFELESIHFTYSEFIGMMGADVITVRRNE
jgi:excisionase family DNA binding protein